MNRRTLLHWLSISLASASAALVAIPGVSYLLATVRRGSRAARVTQRVARLTDLVPGTPYEVAISDRRQDGWTTYPRQPVGRVWLVRQTDRSVAPAENVVQAFSSICPHLGCRIQFATGTKRFVCPCHKAEFEGDGKLVSSSKLGHANPAPRPMDELECRLVHDEAAGEWWIEVAYEEFVQGLQKQVPSVT